MSEKAPVDEGGEKVPLWYISFADMITLLLAFFVMLQTMAVDQDATFFGREASESFKRTIQGLGIPDQLFGKRQGPEFLTRRIEYPTQEENAPKAVERQRLIDAQDNYIRNLFSELKKSVDTKSSDAPQKPIIQQTADVRFAPGSAALDDGSRQWLDAFASQIKQELASRRIKLQVIGLCPEKLAAKDAWLLAAARAQAVGDYLTKIVAPLDKDGRWEIVPLGSGNGGNWIQKFGGAAGQSYVLIAIMEAQNSNDDGNNSE